MPNICDVCGRDNRSGEELCPWCFPLSEYEVEEKPHDTAHVQEYPGLDAAGFLLVALGHLAAAMRELRQEPASEATYKALVYATEAGNFARYALKLLDEQKEEMCEKP